MSSEAQCPFNHGAGGGTTNRDWWPQQLRLDLLQQQVDNDRAKEGGKAPPTFDLAPAAGDKDKAGDVAEDPMEAIRRANEADKQKKP